MRLAEAQNGVGVWILSQELEYVIENLGLICFSGGLRSNLIIKKIKI